MSPVGDNHKAAITVVEFFGSNGPHCCSAEAMVTERIEGDPDVRFVYKEPPTRRFVPLRGGRRPNPL